MESKTIYFEKPGKENTDATFAICKKRADELGIKNIVVASTRGYSALKAVDFFKGYNLIIVSHCFGFKEPNADEFGAENRKKAEAAGVKIITAAHVFGGLSRALRQGDIPQAQSTYVVGDLVAETLRIFGQGMKVCCEIACMAADAGLVRVDQEAIAIAGVGKLGGADTAIIVQPEPSHRFFGMKVKELLCKPRF
ncbi:pyruvate kinase alpha/beta domain-containing protein [Chloroflexota bacterium]